MYLWRQCSLSIALTMSTPPTFELIPLNTSTYDSNLHSPSKPFTTFPLLLHLPYHPLTTSIYTKQKVEVGTCWMAYRSIGDNSTEREVKQLAYSHTAVPELEFPEFLVPVPCLVYCIMLPLKFKYLELCSEFFFKYLPGLHCLLRMNPSVKRELNWA